MKNIKIMLAVFSLILVGCSDDDSVTGGDGGSGTVTFTEGVYSVTSVTMYSSEACSGTGITGMCFYDETATTEADCPLGICSDDESADEDACTAAGETWMTGMCLDEYGDGLQDEDAHVSAAACEGLDGNWVVFGWNSLSDMYSAMMGNITLGADGVFTNPEGDVGTYTVVENAITITETCCYDGETDECTDATTADACADGDWEEETISGTVNSDGTVTVEMASEAYCNDDVSETQAECEAACDENSDDCPEWHEAECTSIVWTLSN